MAENPQPEAWVREALREGVAIPAHPLALTEEGAFDPPCQRALTRYFSSTGNHSSPVNSWRRRLFWSLRRIPNFSSR